MEIRLSYSLIFMLYILVIITKSIELAFAKNYIQNNEQAKEFRIYRKDFIYVVASVSFVGIIIITALTLWGGTPYNYNGPIITLLLVVLAIVSGTTKILVANVDHYIINGENIVNEKIIKVKASKKFLYTQYVIYADKEDNNTITYEFYVSNKNEELNTLLNKVKENTRRVMEKTEDSLEDENI
ncbi:MAG: hypothetical protein ATN35_06870 [Epulopiscium sp. Nele67-Bin004]|nr:MAG: hypothetical protein ATN35_06870 [Epulopiscium sp. Nele67-Bin004]